MLFDEANARTEVAPDLTEPSLEGLSWLLRHQERWGTYHHWDFHHCFRYEGCRTSGCAIGLATVFWPQLLSDLDGEPYFNLAGVLNMSPLDFDTIFNNGSIETTYHVERDGDVTPVMVADAIDKYLAERRK